MLRLSNNLLQADNVARTLFFHQILTANRQQPPLPVLTTTSQTWIEVDKEWEEVNIVTTKLPNYYISIYVC